MVFYAVARGRQIGVFETWEECSKQVNKFSGAIYKKFGTKSDAWKFVYGVPDTSSQKKRGIDLISVDMIEIEVLQHFTDPKDFDLTFVHAYTDGACEKNGSINAKGGIGVYFPNNEYDNISLPLTGKQTNNRAELTAIIAALKTVDISRELIIYTDSQYSLNGISGVNKINVNSDLFTEIFDLIALRKSRPKFVWVEAHTRKMDGNHYADDLAGKGAQKNKLTL